MRTADNPFGITAKSSAVFFDAHPGSLVRTCGGILLRAKSLGAKVAIVDACDGAAMVEEESDGPAMAKLRHREALASNRVLGVGPADYFALGFPDGGLEAIRADYFDRTGLPYFCPWLGTDRVNAPYALEPGAPFFGRDFLRLLKAVLAKRRPTHVFTHHHRDNHLDHRAITWFIKQALAGLKLKPRVYEWITYYHRLPWPPKTPSISRGAAERMPFDGKVIEFTPTPSEQRIKVAAWQKHGGSHPADYVKRWTKRNEVFWRCT